MDRLSLKRQIGKIWPAKYSNRKVILLYHTIGETPWGLSEKKFRDQINWLAENCQLLSLADLIKTKENSNLQVAITFDDGYKSLHEIVAPLLLDKKTNCTVYINTGWIGENEKERKKSIASLGHYPDELFLIWDEIKDLYCQANWEIGSHGVNHYDFKSLEERFILEEFIQSKKQIENYLNTPCLHFAYPFGRYSTRTQQLVKLSGYQYAAAVRHEPFHVVSDYFALPRLNIDRNYSLKDFKQVVQGKWDFIGLIHKIRGQ
jgi:peptidoglycan/xylan/chitin deacetylase (PgdA/CDA1 family)